MKINYSCTTMLYGLVVLSMTICLIKCEDCPPYEIYLIMQQSHVDRTSPSYLTQKAQYQSNCRMIHFSNQINDYELGATHHMGLSFEQIKTKYGVTSLKFSSNPGISINDVTTDPSNIKVSSGTLPAAYSLVSLGFVSSVKNQGSCGCCWSFAGTSMYQSYLKQRGFTYGLSQEAALQCTSYYSPGNRVSDCEGGYFQDTFRFFEKVGSVLRSNFPYISGNWGPNAGHRNTSGICAQKNRIMIGNGTRRIYSNLTASQIKTLLYTQGSLMVGVYASPQFIAYKNGIFSGCPQGSSLFLNHAVVLVGYNDSQGYWLIKNSWDTDWGQNGYMRLSYSRDCGLSSLLGNIQFTSYNTNPQVIITDQSLLYGNASIPTPTPTPTLKVLFQSSFLLKALFLIIILTIV